MENLAIVKSAENKALVRINKQIAIVHKLLAHVNKDKVIEFLSENELFFLRLISRHYAFDERLLIKYQDDFDWGYEGISSNPNILWKKDLLKKFSNRLSWTSLSWEIKNPYEIISLNNVKSDGLSLNENINWSIEFIDANLDKLDFEYLSMNPSLPWSFDFIEYYKKNWNWGWNPSLKNTYSLSLNLGLCWSEELIEKYFDKWDWEQLSKNNGLPWTLEFIEKYESKWEWGIGGLSKNPSLPWAISLIEKFKEKWNWGSHGLSGNEGLPWSIFLLRRYKDKWSEEGLSKNDGIIWNESMINEVKSWGYSEINPYSTKDSPWNIDYILKNYDFIDFHKVYKYESLWRNVFNDVLNYETLTQLLDLNKQKKSYKIFKNQKQIDVLFDEFLSEKDSFWFSAITKLEIKILIQFFKKRLKLHNYINSDKAYNDLVENRKSINDFQNMVNEMVPEEIKSILSRKINSINGQFVFPQDHEMIEFLLTKLSLPDYLQDAAEGRIKSNAQNTVINWLKKKFS